VSLSRTSDDYRTDEWILDLFPDFFDPCPYFGKTNDNTCDGLSISWNYADYHGVFVNPPYSNPLPWVEKAIAENKLAIETLHDPDDGYDGSALRIVMLLKHDTSTKWFRLLHEHGCHFLMVQGRLKHQTPYSAPFPSVLVVFPE